MIDAVRSALLRPPALLGSTDLCAVAAIFDADLQLLLIRRAERNGDPWSGHVSLPGGRMEPEDPDALATAIRETREEVGLELPESALLGQLDDVVAVGGRPGLVIRPFVFGIEALPTTFTPNDEVASIHRLSLSRLLGNEGRGWMPFEHRGTSLELPCVDFDGQRLWGLTLRMVDDLLHRLDGLGIGLDRLGPGA